MPLKIENEKIDCFYKIILPLHYQNLSNMLWFYEDDSILNTAFSAFQTATNSFNKSKRCRMTLEDLGRVCAKLEPASSKNNGMQR